VGVEAAVDATAVRGVEDDAWRRLVAARQQSARTVSQAEDLSRPRVELVAAASCRHLVADIRNSARTHSGMLTAQRPEARGAGTSGITFQSATALERLLGAGSSLEPRPPLLQRFSNCGTCTCRI
jgi:hypothetical protein